MCISETASATLAVLPDPCDPIASGNTDTDGDGLSDMCDLDDDNDGITDLNECGVLLPTAITTAMVSNNPSGQYVNDAFSVDFELETFYEPDPTAPGIFLQIDDRQANVTEGLQAFWNEGTLGSGAQPLELTYTLSNVQNGCLLYTSPSPRDS